MRENGETPTQDMEILNDRGKRALGCTVFNRDAEILGFGFEKGRWLLQGAVGRQIRISGVFMPAGVL
jgi:hypothetical protein